MELTNNNRPPQADVPTELIIHYIVKDYRRMYEGWNTLVDKVTSQQKEIDYLKRMLEHKTETPTGKIKAQIDGLTTKCASLSEKLSIEHDARIKATNKYNKVVARLKKLQTLLTSLPAELDEELY